jgi:regulator of replication initiation timing
MDNFIISNHLRDAVTAFPKEEAATITALLPTFTTLIDDSDALDDILKTLLSEKKVLNGEINHYQERIREFAIERAEINRRTPNIETPEMREDARRREARDFLQAFR